MKKFFIILLFLNCCNTYGQDSTWAPTGAIWYYTYASWPSPWIDVSYLTYESKGDTLIQGKSCRNINDLYIMYKDSGKVFYFNDYDTTFYLLYDFLSDVNETWTVHPPDSPQDSFVVIVDSIATWTVNSKLFKIQYISHLDPDDWLFWFDGPIIENIGWYYDLIPWPGAADPTPGPIRCYEDSLIGHFVFDSTINGACDTDYIISNLENVIQPNNQYIFLRPNPFSHATTITTNFEQLWSYGDVYLSIYNTLGIEVKNLLISSNQSTLYRDKLPVGMYYYMARKGNEVVGIGKFAIQ